MAFHSCRHEEGGEKAYQPDKVMTATNGDRNKIENQERVL